MRCAMTWETFLSRIESLSLFSSRDATDFCVYNSYRRVCKERKPECCTPRNLERVVVTRYTQGVTNNFAALAVVHYAIHWLNHPQTLLARDCDRCHGSMEIIKGSGKSIVDNNWDRNLRKLLFSVVGVRRRTLFGTVPRRTETNTNSNTIGALSEVTATPATKPRIAVRLFQSTQSTSSTDRFQVMHRCWYCAFNFLDNFYKF